MFGIPFSICLSAASRLAIIPIIVLLSQSVLQATAQLLPIGGLMAGFDNPAALLDRTMFNLSIIEELYVAKNYTTSNGPTCFHVSTPSEDSNPEGIWWTCPSGSFCLAPNMSSPCPPGYWCPTNTSQPLYCCGGYYCANPGKISVCPSGYYCPIAVTQPIRCIPLLADCPPGTMDIQNTGIGTVVAGFIVFSLIVFALKSHVDILQRAKYDQLINNNYLSKKKHRKANMNVKIVERSFDVEFSNLSFVLPNGVEIMKGVSGTLRAGRTCAIMGPSGAGKTTFVSLLTGKVKKTSGVIKVNGVEEPLGKYRKLIGFVPQEDTMMRELTVRNNLTFSAMMRLPRQVTYVEKRKRVLDTIKFLGLSHIMNNVIGDVETRGISGGQRKRVNIGMELVADPSILFLDEPTSGLDSTTSLEVCTLLHDIARKQKMTIAAVIHSPNPPAFDQFDDLLLLGKGGQIVYFGPCNEAPKYFARIGFPCPPDVSHADHYISVTSGKVISEIDPRFVPNDLFVYWTNYVAGNPLVVPFRSTVSVDFDQGSITEKPLLNDFEDIRTETDSRASMSTTTTTTSTVKRRKSGVSTFFSHLFLNLWAVIRDLLGWVWGVVQEFGMWLLGILLFFRSDPIRDTPNAFQVFWLCFKRALVQIYTNKPKFFLDSLLHLGCGLFISIAVKNSFYLGRQPEEICSIAPGVLRFQCSRPMDFIAQIGVFLSLGVLFAGISSGSSTFGSERVVFWRDTSAGMPAIPYFVAKVAADIPRVLSAAFLFTLSFILFLDSRSTLYNIFYIVLLVYMTAFAMGYLISMLFKKDIVALVGTGTSLAWGMVFSGQNPNLSLVNSDPFFRPWVWIWTTSAPRWAVEALYLKEADGRPFIELHSDEPLSNTYDYANYIPAIYNMLYIAIGWNLLAFLALKLTHRDKQK